MKSDKIRKNEVKKEIKKRRKKKQYIENLPLPSKKKIDYLAKTLARQIDKEIFQKKYAPVREVLKVIGAGAFIAASFAAPNLPQALRPFLSDTSEYEVWKRFNIPYLKRAIERLERQKLVEIDDEDGKQVIKITDGGRRRILKYSLEELAIKKPKHWDGTWRLVSYDLPEKLSNNRKIFHEYLLAWGFYPLHESVYLHAYPCIREVDFLREYLGIGEYVRIFKVAKIENDRVFRDFFGI